MMTRPLVRSSWARWGLLALIQLALLAIPLADRLDVQLTGKEVTLEVRPVDPRDLLRGDYVIINLAIMQLEKLKIAGTTDLKPGDRVYVSLEAGPDGIARAKGISKQRDLTLEHVIAGTVRSVNDQEVWVDYGLDAFYVPEGTGREIERLDASRISLVAALHADGRSLPLRLLVDGKPFKSEGAF